MEKRGSHTQPSVAAHPPIASLMKHNGREKTAGGKGQKSQKTEKQKYNNRDELFRLFFSYLRVFAVDR